LVLVAWDPHDISDALTVPYAATVDPPKEGFLSRDGVPIRNFYYRVAHDLAAR
jgi:hypothetical protein